MSNKEIISNTVKYVKTELQNAEGGHDWWHIHRVWSNAQILAKNHPGCNPLVVELGALLHDIADYKFNNGDENIGPQKASSFLRKLGVGNEVIEAVEKIIRNVSFKGGNFKTDYSSLELDIVQDADRLDALGAIGIARTFNYGGFKNRPLYDPDIAPKMNMNKEEYKNSTAPTLNHFYEKLFLLKDRMNTEAGKNMALERHQYMVEFVERFKAEFNGSRA